MFKLKFLKWRTDSALRKNRSLRASMPFKHAKNIGIIFSVEDRQKHNDVKEFVHQLEQDGKTVKVLEFLPRKKENYEFLFDFFTIQDLSFWGNINSRHAENFMQTGFDYLFCVDKQSNPLVLNLLARSKAKCRVGRFTENESDYFELMIETQGTTRGLIESMYKYARQLK